MKRILLLGSIVLAGGLFWAARPTNNSPKDLVEGLNGPDAVECFAQLRQWEDEKVDAAIVEGTRHATARVRGQCARLLGQRQDITMVSVLTPLLSDKNPGVRNQAARSLLPLLDDEEIVELLRSAPLSAGSQLVMFNALLRDPLALTDQGLMSWALDRNHSSELREGCYLALRTHHSPCFGDKKSEKEQLPAVLAARARIQKQTHEDAADKACPIEVRCAALPLNALLRGPSAYNEMLGYLQAPELRLQQSSLLALALTQDGRSWPLFQRLAADPKQPTDLRLEALGGIRHLAKLQGKEKEAFPLFCRIADNAAEPVVVRAAAVGYLRHYPLELDALRIARQGLVDKDPLVRQKAAACLSRLGDRNAPLDSPLRLESSLTQVKQALSGENDAETKCAMQGAICSLESRIANRGK